MSSQLQPRPTIHSPDFRPASYWDLSDPVTVIISAIAGQYRRRLARSTMAGGSLEDPGYFPDEIFAEQLSDGRRASFKVTAAALGVGEYLPALTEGSVEIARLIFTLRGESKVASVRAFRDTGGWIRYSVVDEEDVAYTCHAPKQRQPLSLRQLETLIESIKPSDPEIAAAWDERADELKDLRVEAESLFYPGLVHLFEERLKPAPHPREEPAQEVDYFDLVWGETDESLVFIPRVIAHDLARTQRACREARTWGEFRRLAAYDDYLNQFEHADGWDEENDRPITDDSPFHPSGWEDGDFPDWPQQKMLKWLPPELFATGYATLSDSVHNGQFIVIDPVNREPVLATLRRLGYRCRRSQKLVLGACGMA